MTWHPRRLMRRQRTHKRMPIERCARPFVDGNQEIERILMHVHFEPGLFQRRELRLFLETFLQFPLLLPRLPLFPLPRGLQSSSLYVTNTHRKLKGCQIAQAAPSAESSSAEPAPQISARQIRA